jgi:acyl carrier protein
MNPTAEPRAVVRRWLAANARCATPIEDDTPILDLRIIDSLKVLELVLLVEELTGRPVTVAQLVPSSFRDVDSICTTFFAGEERAHER